MVFSLKNVRLDGCRRSRPDPRDFRTLFRNDREVPDRVDLRQYCTAVEDQGHIGSCTSNATVGAVEYQYCRRDGNAPDFSRLFVYYNVRRMYGNVNEDSGAEIRFAMGALMTYGICAENLWPYDPALFAVEPPRDAYEDAMKHQILQYARVDGGQRAINSLAAGLPVIFAIYMPDRCYEEAAKTGVVPVLRGEERKMNAEAGHAMLMVGYDKAEQTFLVRNSWGEDWGDRGYCRIPFDVMNCCCYPEDFWVIAELDKQSGFELIRPAMPGLSRSAALAVPTGGGIAGMAGSMREQIRSSLAADLEASSRRIDSILTGNIGQNTAPRSDSLYKAPVAEPGWKNWDGSYFKASFPPEWSVRENASGVTFTSPAGDQIVSFGYVTGGFAPGNYEQIRSSFLQAVGIEIPRYIKESEPAKAGFGTTRVSEFSGNRDRTPMHGVITVTLFSVYGSYGYSGYIRMGPANQWAESSSTLEKIEQSIVLLSGKHAAFRSLSGVGI